MKISGQKIRLGATLIITLLVFSGCSKKVSTMEGISPSTGEPRTTVEVDTTGGIAGTEEVVTEPLALLSPDFTEDAIEPVEPSDAPEVSEGLTGLSESGTDAKMEALRGGLTDIFFDFDMAILKQEEIDNLKKNAEWLKKIKSAVIRIEGYADERGTSEYNLALGEKRANMIKKYLAVFGIMPSRINIVSYGEEKGFCAEHNEECWAQNRRGHFVVLEREVSN